MQHSASTTDPKQLAPGGSSSGNSSEAAGGLQYGVRGVRQLRAFKKSDLFTKAASLRQKDRQALVFEYFRNEVDPIIENLVTYLLCAQPDDVPAAAHAYLTTKRDSGQEPQVPEASSTRATKEHRAYLVTYISPVISRVVKEITRHRPDKVLEFMCEAVAVIMDEERAKAEAPAAVAAHNAPAVVLTADDHSPSSNNLLRSSVSDKRPMTAGAALSSSSHLHMGGLGDTEPPGQPAQSKQPRPESAPLVKHENSVPVPQELQPPQSQQSQARPQTAGAVSSSSSSSNAAAPPAPKPKAQEMQIVVIGPDNAGKTSFLNALQGQPHVRTRPTVGFRPVTMMLGEDVKIKFYDLGGGAKIRDIWDQYYHDVHAFVYVIDAAAEAERLKESAALFEKLRSNAMLQGKPGLILANKQDKNNAMSVSELASTLSIDSSNSDALLVVKGCMCTPAGSSNSSNAEAAAEAEGEAEEDVSVDPRLEDAMVWLLDSVKSNYDRLNAKVIADTAQKDALEAAKRAQRERNVLRNKIACAFMDQIDKNVKDVNIATANPNDLYGEVDGLAYLSGETGVDLANMDPIAIEVARLVGYQRLALQMVGAMSAPVNKKKDPLPWSQIRDLVLELRKELGLPDN